jgi:hypothetical protein
MPTISVSLIGAQKCKRSVCGDTTGQNGKQIEYKVRNGKRRVVAVSIRREAIEQERARERRD